MSTKNYNKDLQKAEKLLRQKKYKQALDFLVPKITLFLESPLFYYYMGQACFFTGAIGDARLYLNKCLQLEKNSERAELLIAAVYLKSRKTTEAVQIWLDILDREPTHKIAKRGLNIVRKISDPDELIAFTESSSLEKLIPRWPLRLNRLIAFPVTLVVVGISLFFALPYIKLIPELIRHSKEKLVRENMVPLNMEEFTSLTTTSGAFLYVLTENEIEESLNLAYNYLNHYEDNKALRELNRIKYSNASEEVKAKASLLASVVVLPDIIQFKDDFSYAKVSKDPFLYENCAILWKGKISNLIVGDKDIRFDFLIGYEKEQILLGIVPVLVDFPIDLDVMKPIELMAQVIPGTQGEISLKTIAVHHIVP